MKITNSFNNYYWGAIINDIHNNLSEIVWNDIRFNLKSLSKENLHELFKIITFNNKSITEMTNKEVVNYLEEIRVLLGENGHVLKIDELEWERLIKSIKGGRSEHKRSK